MQPGQYKSLHYTDNRGHFLGLSLMQNRREAHMFYLAREGERFRDVLVEKR